MMEMQIIELKKYWKGMENHDYDLVKNLTSDLQRVLMKSFEYLLTSHPKIML